MLILCKHIVIIVESKMTVKITYWQQFVFFNNVTLTLREWGKYYYLNKAVKKSKIYKIIPVGTHSADIAVS